MKRTFVFLEDYPRTGPMWEKKMLATADLDEYFRGLPRKEVYEIIIAFLLPVLKEDCGEIRRHFARQFMQMINFLGDERFEDEADFDSFVQERLDEMTKGNDGR
jgi:hypothetical protein